MFVCKQVNQRAKNQACDHANLADIFAHVLEFLNGKKICQRTPIARPIRIDLPGTVRARSVYVCLCGRGPKITLYIHSMRYEHNSPPAMTVFLAVHKTAIRALKVMI